MAPAHSIKYDRVASSSVIDKPQQLVGKLVRFPRPTTEGWISGTVKSLARNQAHLIITDDGGREWDAHWLTLEVESSLPRPTLVHPRNTFTRTHPSNHEALNKRLGQASGVTDIVYIHFDRGEDGGVEYEFRVSWHLLSKIPTPRLEIFSDAWKVFEDVPELFEMFAEYHAEGSDKLTPEKLSEELIGMGFVHQPA